MFKNNLTLELEGMESERKTKKEGKKGKREKGGNEDEVLDDELIESSMGFMRRMFCGLSQFFFFLSFFFRRWINALDSANRKILKRKRASIGKQAHRDPYISFDSQRSELRRTWKVHRDRKRKRNVTDLITVPLNFTSMKRRKSTFKLVYLYKEFN